MAFYSFFNCPDFHFWDIFLDVLFLYNKNENLGTPNQWTSKTSTNKKKYLWFITTCNRWYNIGIYPIWDYINHGTTTIYQSFQCIYDNNTWTSNTSSYMNESETIHECNTWKERPYIKPYNLLYHNRIIYSIILYYIVYIGLYHNRIISMYPR